MFTHSTLIRTGTGRKIIINIIVGHSINNIRDGKRMAGKSL
jgi:hypothetical protein